MNKINCWIPAAKRTIAATSAAALILMLLFSACGRRDQLPASLEQASWQTVEPGIAIAKLDRQPAIKDSLEVSLIYPVIKISDEQTAFVAQVSAAITDLALVYLKNKSVAGDHGYLRIDPQLLLSTEPLSFIIYLEDSYDSSGFVRDSLELIRYPDVMHVKYVSKQEAKKRYISDGNKDWENVLDTNPLPQSIEILLKQPGAPAEVDSAQAYFQRTIPGAVDISHTSGHFGDSDNEKTPSFYFEYRR